jgi:hypothetical protein
MSFTTDLYQTWLVVTSPPSRHCIKGPLLSVCKPWPWSGGGTDPASSSASSGATPTLVSLPPPPATCFFIHVTEMQLHRSNQCCGSGAFLTPGSGIRNRFFAGTWISDPKPIFLRA